MSNIASLDFVVLDIFGDNYLAWALDAEFWLNAKGLGQTIISGNTEEGQNKAKAMIFIRRHLHEDLKNEYLTVKDAHVLWENLKERYDHQKTVILPRARYDWVHLRLQDFKSVAEYNSAMFRIASKLKLCGEKITEADKLEKTFSTFHANNVVLQTQYREKEFTKYSQLISCLLVAEQTLDENHGLRPTGSAPFPEANMALNGRKEQNHANKSRWGSGYSRGRGYGREYGRGQGRGRGISFKKPHQKWNSNKQERSITQNVCHRCGGNNHWAKNCRTPKRFVDLYQQSLKHT